MANYSVNVSTIQRSKGQNAIACAAYISRNKLELMLTDKLTGVSWSESWDYRSKPGLAYSKIYTPTNLKGKLGGDLGGDLNGELGNELGNLPDWVTDRELLWNKVEQGENRCNSEVGGKIMVALPNEFSLEQNIALSEDIVKYLTDLGMIVDANIHTDKAHNPHLHLQHTQRELVNNRYGELDFSALKKEEWRGPKWIKQIREMAAEKINLHYKQNGFATEISHKSYKERGIDLTPSRHEGPARNIKNAELAELNRQIAQENAEKIKAKPSIILDLIGMNHPVFTKEQIAIELEKRLHAGIDFDKIEDVESLQSELSQTFTVLYEQILSSKELTQVVESDLRGRALYTTTKRLELEERFTSNVEALNSRHNHALDISDSDLEHLSRTEKLAAKVRDIKSQIIDHINDNTGMELAKPKPAVSLSEEQRRAVVNILNGSDIAVLEGIPGAGKTTAMREIVRQYKKAGFAVIGVAPSSSASLELAKASGIRCQNASLWRKEWQEARGMEFELVLRGDYYKEDQYQAEAGSGLLTKNHVMIIDEASMGELANMDYLISEARLAGAKVLLVGDNNQLSPVGWAGALGRTIDICGSQRLEESRRQQNPLHMQATKYLSQYRVRDALEIYRNDNAIKIEQTASAAHSKAASSFVREYMASAAALKRDDLVSIRTVSVGVFANETREKLNKQIRGQLKEAGIVKGQEHRVLVGSLLKDGRYEKQYLNLARGEQIVFTRNANRLGRSGVFNGEFATILKVHKPNSEALAKIELLVHKASGRKEKVLLNLIEMANNKYTGKYFHDGIAIDYGYAVTAHKVQGSSIDRFIALVEKGVGFEVFNVLATRHKQFLEIISDVETLSDAFYESLDRTSALARNRFELMAKDAESLIRGGLAKMLSKRTNTLFADSYRKAGKLAEDEAEGHSKTLAETHSEIRPEDQILKSYLDKSEETIAVVRKITYWQMQQQRKTGYRPEMWEHAEYWSEFQEAKEGRAEAANRIVFGYAENGELGGDLTNAEHKEHWRAASYAKFKERIMQLGLNYATLEKHASQLAGASELDKTIINTIDTTLYQHEKFVGLVQCVAAGDTEAVINSYKELNNYIADTHLAIESALEKIANYESQQQELLDAIDREQNYRKILTPEYLSRIYRSNDKSNQSINEGGNQGGNEDGNQNKHGNAGAANLAKYDALVEKYGEAKAASMVGLMPTLLGSLKGIGFGKIIGIGGGRKDAIELCKNLEQQLRAYNKSGEIMMEYSALLQEGDYGNKIAILSKEVEYLRTLLPSEIENKFMQEVEGELDKRVSGKIDWGKCQESELFETVSLSRISRQLEEDSQGLHEDWHKSFGLDLRHGGEQDLDALHHSKEQLLSAAAEQKVKVATVLELKALDLSNPQQNWQQSKLQQQNSQQQKLQQPTLTFGEVKGALDSSVVQSIFRKYAPLLNPDGKIKLQGKEIACGSISMQWNGSKMGSWFRHSSSQGGDIFKLVEEAAGVGKREALEIVAAEAGIRLDVKSTYASNAYDRDVIAGKEKKAAIQKVDIIKKDKDRLNDEWIAISKVPVDAPKFNPEIDLKKIIKAGNKISLVHEYRNTDNQLLGYTARIEDKAGKKQVLPVAWCSNELSGKSRWQLKGFSDNGNKPIYGAEKLSGDLTRPVVIVEGEKTADVAQKLLPEHSVISWMGGAQGINKVDWSKLKDRQVIIWPDNDRPGIEAAGKIREHIDQHNGFSGMVSIVDVEKLKLPEKWDLADRLPEHLVSTDGNGIDKSSNRQVIESIITGAAQQQQSYGAGLVSKVDTRYVIVRGDNNLELEDRVKIGGYLSSQMYKTTLAVLAENATKNENRGHNIGDQKIGSQKIDLTDQDNYASSMCRLQEAYTKMQYEHQIECHKENQGEYGSKSGRTAGATSKKEMLEEALIRDTSVLHKALLNRSKLLPIHNEQIEKTVKEKVGQLKQFKDADIRHVAELVFKETTSKGWVDKLEQKNIDQVHNFEKRCAEKKAEDRRNEVFRWHSLQIDSLKKMKTTIDFDKLANKLTEMPLEQQKEHINKLTITETKKHVDPLLANHEMDKAKAKNLKEMMGSIASEQKTYLQLEKDHSMSVYALDNSEGHKKLSLLLAAASDLDKQGGIDRVQKVIDHAIEHGIVRSESMLERLRTHGSNMKKISEELHFECKQHHVNVIDKNLNILHQNIEVRIGNHSFKDPASYLKHMKSNYDHNHIPVDHINKHLQHIEHHEQQQRQQLQKDMHLGKEMGGPSF